MLGNSSSHPLSSDHGAVRHPIWMLVGAIVGFGASIGSLALASWYVPGTWAAVGLFFPLFSFGIGVVLFRRSELPAPTAWPLVGFPLLIGGALYLSGIIRVFSPPGGSQTVLIGTLVIVGVALAHAHHAKKQPADTVRLRRTLPINSLIVAGVISGCIAMTVAAYIVPLPALKAAAPSIVATSFAAWLTMSLIMAAWFATRRARPPATTHSAAAYS